MNSFRLCRGAECGDEAERDSIRQLLLAVCGEEGRIEDPSGSSVERTSCNYQNIRRRRRHHVRYICTCIYIPEVISIRRLSEDLY